MYSLRLLSSYADEQAVSFAFSINRADKPPTKKYIRGLVLGKYTVHQAIIRDEMKTIGEYIRLIRSSCSICIYYQSFPQASGYVFERVNDNQTRVTLVSQYNPRGISIYIS